MIVSFTILSFCHAIFSAFEISQKLFTLNKKVTLLSLTFNHYWDNFTILPRFEIAHFKVKANTSACINITKKEKKRRERLAKWESSIEKSELPSKVRDSDWPLMRPSHRLC